MGKLVNSTEEKFTAVSLIQYHHSTGLIMRSSGNLTLIGYCIESPKKVLENVFENYYVTRYNGYELFSSGDFESTTPMIGLGINSIEPPNVYGIQYTGRLEELLQLNELLKVKRTKPISSKDLQRIISHLNEKQNTIFMNPTNNKIDKQEIIEVIRRFE